MPWQVGQCIADALGFGLFSIPVQGCLLLVQPSTIWKFDFDSSDFRLNFWHVLSSVKLSEDLFLSFKKRCLNKHLSRCNCNIDIV